jgi:hypothetical protein
LGGYCNNGQWSDDRYAVLMKAGFHNCHFKVGYYTQVMGLGRDPTKTEIRELEVPDGCNNALCNFWRSVENIHTGYHGTTQWHVSQAAPMRRVQIEGSIQLGQGYSSGGYLANSNIKGNINAASQQQWFNRNNNMSGWSGGAWSFVHLGCKGAPSNYCGHGAAHSNVDKTPIIAEKPYLIESNNKYSLVVPKYESNKQGYSWNSQNEDEIPFDRVYVANEHDSAATINNKFKQVDYVVLQPGHYNLSEPIKINKDRQVLLGIGMPTLTSTHGNAVVEVGDHVGVRVAGLLIEPGSNTPGETLLKWGTNASSGSEKEPGVLSDVFGRVGGPHHSSSTQVQVKRMVQINSSHVVLDHTWLWRADHDEGGSVYSSRNYVASGLEVNGNHVRGYGVFVEHTLGDMLRWNGEDGEVYFYQSELPYDVTQDNYASKGYHSYRVADNVKRHTSFGAGVYSFFRDNSVTMDTGIKAPSGSGIKFYNAFNKFLSGQGGISHVLNNQGGGAFGGGMSYLCGYHSENPTAVTLNEWEQSLDEF